MGPNARELRHILELVVSLQEVARPEVQARRVLDGVRRLVTCDVAAYNEVGQQGVLVITDPPDAASRAEVDALVRHRDVHPLIAYHRRVGHGRAVRISDLVSRREWHRNLIFQDVFRPQGLEHQVAMALTQEPGGPLIGLALNRAGRDFSQHERQVLEALRTPLAIALQQAVLRARLDRDRTAALAALEAAGVGLVILGPRGELEELNPRAHELLVRYAGQHERTGVLTEPLASWLRSPTQSEMAVDGPRGRMHARLVRQAWGASEDAVMLREVVQRGPDDLAALGLTRRQSEVLWHASRGQSTVEIARALSVSPRTVEKHLEHAYVRLGVHTRTQALARIARLDGGS